ncbi:MAG: symmetrical bis(5'-nucleosyl)-tetraphosphatase [Gammaproteobacteria bacterium]|nr:symmetrical bis(5'-nucleosyl)-tetraphosphatase [Gammaproteobacteria bacterium]
MATYAVGDIQGCHAEFAALLDEVAFDERHDALWLLGDLVNRGPDSLAVMERVMALGDRVTTVLGNHDLHFLAIWYGGHPVRATDTFTDLLAAPEAPAIANWLRRQPFFHQDPSLGYAMVHAGILPGWTFADAQAASDELMGVLEGPEFKGYFRDLYGDRPRRLKKKHVGMDRWRILTNGFTRIRLVDAKGRLDFKHKGALNEAPPDCRPWYELAADALDGQRLLFGHWAALNGHTGKDNLIALDTGCVWGRSLTALCLESGERIVISAIGATAESF